ncbi:polysaccharide export protein [Sphingomonas sp. PL-96]|uniref:polysaccharide biosynthesis/export family protein n=1 Tax=Sphingomonas sp. PL-96 TaxID=2887201 RepID=UPI001E2FE9D7|nr:polysaccharide biosynthesis/export family protein [Sphingomonas sp. PL-96]MCC2976599.1 polysaccharide export protein [Sphingomonas sp. PL-96]
MLLKKPYALMLPFLALAGCSSNNGAVPERLSASGEAPYLPTYRYPLSGGDKLRVGVFGAPQLGGEFTIGGSGYIALPLIGEVAAKGLTSTQLQDLIARKLADGYVNEPRVSVEVLTTRPYYILGEVNKPGEYAFADGLTVQSAVAKAGGYTYRAKTKEITIKHAGETSATAYALTPSTPVAPGDTIEVRERWF